MTMQLITCILLSNVLDCYEYIQKNDTKIKIIINTKCLNSNNRLKQNPHKQSNKQTKQNKAPYYQQNKASYYRQNKI